MADTFNTVFSGPSEPRGPRSLPVQGQAPIQRDGTAALARGLTNLMKQGLQLSGEITEGNIVESVDNAVQSAAQQTLGIDSEVDDIETTLGRLADLKDSGSGNIRDQFNLRLNSELKRLHDRYPTRGRFIQQTLRAKGIADPAADLVARQIGIQEAEEAQQSQFEERQMNAAIDAGLQVYNTPADPSSGINKDATLLVLNEYTAAQAAKSKALSDLGAFRNKNTGAVEFTLRDAYIHKQPTLRSSVYKEAVIGIRPYVNEVNTILKDGRIDNNEVERLTALRARITSDIDKFRNQQFSATVGNLNEAETKDHMKFVDDTLTTLSQGILGGKDIKDLSMWKSMAETWAVITDSYNVTTAAELPSIAYLQNLNPAMATSIMNAAKFKPGILKPLSDKVGADLSRLPDMLGTNTPPGGVDAPEAFTAIPNMSDDDANERTVVGSNMVNDMASRGTVIDNKAGAYAFVHMQKQAAAKLRDKSLSINDIKSLADGVSHSNWIANYTRAKDLTPKQARQLGGYAYDLVTERLLTISRELQNSRLGDDFNIKMDPSSGQFVYTGEKKRTFTGPTFGVHTSGTLGLSNKDAARLHSVDTRLKEMNKLARVLHITRDTKDFNKGLSDADFAVNMTNLVQGIANTEGQGDIQGDVQQVRDGINAQAVAAPDNAELDSLIKDVRNLLQGGEGNLGE